MNILKFGGTSVTGIETQLNILNIVKNSDEKIILVLSAFSQVTNKLEQICQLDILVDEKELNSLFGNLNMFHKEMIAQLSFKSSGIEIKLMEEIELMFAIIQKTYISTQNVNYLMAQGEYLSTKIFQAWFLDQEVDSNLYDSMDFISINSSFEPNHSAIEKAFNQATFNNKVSIFQGFVCKDQWGKIANLQRGGSDYTATIIGAAVSAKEVQIWTDIDGFHNNDPRVIDNTFPIRFLSYNEAAELAYFGAKILHPSCLQTVRLKKIPVVLKNTSCPENQGTLISEKTSKRIVTAIAAKDNIHVIKIESARMLNSHGFLFNIFSVFNNYGKSIDTITTSEVSVSLTVDNEDNIYEILNELKEFGKVEYESGMSIICVVGDFINERKGIVASVVDCLTEIPLRMISYGGSENNVTILTETEHKVEALRLLNDQLFQNTTQYASI